MGKAKVIAIDGPCGSGKSTVAKDVAARTGAVYVDTGAMYRAIGWYLKDQGISFEEGDRLNKALETIKMSYGVSSEILVTINGKDLTKKIREKQVSQLASIASKLPSVRTFLLEFQRDFARQNLCVMEGRDIGTVIFPDAFCKIYLEASPEVRARRRLLQLQTEGSAKDSSLTYDWVLEDIRIRDERDMNREIAPLKMAPDSLLLETSTLDKDEVVDTLVAMAKAQAKRFGLEFGNGKVA